MQQGEGLMKEETFPHTQKPPHGQGWGWGSFGTSEWSAMSGSKTENSPQKLLLNIISQPRDGSQASTQSRGQGQGEEGYAEKQWERETENEAWVIEDNLEKHTSNSAKIALNPPKYPSEEGDY